MEKDIKNKPKKVVKEHITTRKLEETVIVPEHEQRSESSEFRKTKKKLKEDGHYQCWICGRKDDLDVHHFCCEYSLQKDVDYDKLKDVCETFDIYGYGKEMKDIPMTSVDDIRNAMVLCREHHMDYNDGCKNGIHDITFPIWISQKVSKTGQDPVPDDTEEIEIAKELCNDDKKDF